MKMKSKCIIIVLMLFLISLININHSDIKFTNLCAQITTAEYYKETDQGKTHYKYIRYIQKKSSKKRSQRSRSYAIPRRAIEITPYYNFIYANKLYENIQGKQRSHGGGIKMRTQLYGSFGYIINASINHLKVQENIFIDQENDRDMAAIITGGPYYSYKTSYGDIRLDIGYGAIVAGDSSMTIFLPSVEYRINIFSRISLMIEIGYPIANDWIIKHNFNEHYRSFSSAGGIGIIF